MVPPPKASIYLGQRGRWCKIPGVRISEQDGATGRVLSQQRRDVIRIAFQADWSGAVGRTDYGVACVGAGWLLGGYYNNYVNSDVALIILLCKISKV